MKHIVLISAMLVGCASGTNTATDNMLTCSTNGHVVYSGPVEDVLVVGNAIVFTPLDGPQRGARLTAVNMNCISGHIKH